MKLLLTSVLFALFPLLASAIPITGGTITIGHITGDFNFSGTDFSVSGGMYLDNWAVTLCCHPAPTTVGVTAIQTGTDFASGTASVGGTTLNVGWGSDDPNANQPTNTHFEISGPPITVNDGTGTYQGPFSFTGSLCGNPGGNPVAARTSCVVSLPGLTGSGVVYLNIAEFPQGQVGLDLVSAVYVFTPEPQTWMLASAGIIVVLGWRWKMA